ncbi:hypothetical protein L249_4876 [Ophiocordyceps polyrhachis-furcata BCC 54312]|uniref:Rhodopsin domain-containing protein n=1 Tax=Ophiocordyceps polyrhachis-furcata BCC 54312 TaxID=1330021 RepID=A0A367L2K5_9HYPO|nr:hypothetical protein L249_4876 [Ophiocordyceps polyrhachis-furcata BCC 54312]
MDLSDFVKPNVDLSRSNAPGLVVVCALFLPLTWLAVGLRTYARGYMTRNFQIDDWLMLVALVTFTLTCCFVLAGVGRGLGKHNAALSIPDLVAALMWQSIATSIYILNMMFVKLSIGIFLLRLTNVWAIYKWILWISLTIVTLWSIGLFIWDIFQCTPVQKQWDFRIERGQCASPKGIVDSVIALTVLTVSSDWLYALLPIPMVWNVKMTLQAKATVIVILGLGIFASVATLVRLKFLNGLKQLDDLSYTASDTLIWSIIEPGVAIFASSMATIRPLLRFCKIKGFTTQFTKSRPGEEKTQAKEYPNEDDEGKKTGGPGAPALNISEISLNSPGVAVLTNDVGQGGHPNFANKNNSDMTPLEACKKRAQERKNSTMKGDWAAYGISGTLSFESLDYEEEEDGEEIEIGRTATANYGSLSLENFDSMRAGPLVPTDSRPLSDARSDTFVIEDHRRTSTWQHPALLTSVLAGDVDLEAQSPDKGKGRDFDGEHCDDDGHGHDDEYDDGDDVEEDTDDDELLSSYPGRLV